MALANDPRCAVCKSKLRVEVDKRLIAGDSARSVSAWLGKKGVKASKSSVSNHKAKHCGVLQEALERLDQVKPVYEAAVADTVANAELLDELAGMGMRVLRSRLPRGGVPEGLDDLSRPLGGASAAEVSLVSACMREVREAVKAKHELKHGKKVDLDGVDGLISFLAASAGRDEGEGEEAPSAVES